MSKIETPKNYQEFPTALIKNMVSLSTSGFGVVVALAWNEAIRQTVETYISPYLGTGSGIVSLFIYAVVITTLAVIVTMQLAEVERRLNKEKEEAEAEK